LPRLSETIPPFARSSPNRFYVGRRSWNRKARRKTATLDGPHHQACAYVLALKDVPEKELGALIAQKLSPKEGELLARTLDVKNPMGLNGILSPVRHQILSALNGVPRTDTTGAVVQTLYLLLLPEDIITYCPALAESLAKALGREFYPQSVRTAAAD
jgi:hypothetical protein